MKTKDDFRPDVEGISLKELVLGELAQDSNPALDEPIDDLMQKVYAKIEKEAMAIYHSAEPWALKAWALSSILKEQVADEVTDEIAHNLVSPVLEWQEEQPADPVSKYHEKLVADGKPLASAQQYIVVVTKFVARKGRKKITPTAT